MKSRGRKKKRKKETWKNFVNSGRRKSQKQTNETLSLKLTEVRENIAFMKNKKKDIFR